MTQPTTFNTDSGVVSPNTHIPTIRAYFTNAVAYLGTFLQRNGALSDEDRRLTKEVVVHLCYVDILLAKIENAFGDRLPERFNFEDYVAQIIKEFNPYIDGRGMSSISLVALMDVNLIVEKMIQEVHAPYVEPAGPSLVDRLIMWVNSKLEMLASRQVPEKQMHFNNSNMVPTPKKQYTEPKPKWKPKPLEIVQPRQTTTA